MSAGNHRDEGDDEEPPEGERQDFPGATFDDLYASQYRHAQSHLPDRLLVGLVRIAEEDLSTFALTLHVHGQVVSGLLVGETQYFAETAADLERSPDSVFHQVFAKAFREQEASARLARAIDGEMQPPQYIHLLNADVWQGPSRTINGVRWRGRISAVDGWCLGKLEPNASN